MFFVSIIEYCSFFIVRNSDTIIFTKDYQAFIFLLRIKPDYQLFEVL